MAYGTEQGLLDYVASQGLVMPAGANAAVLLQVGSAYVDAAYGWRLTCSRKAGGFNQENEWPRSGHFVNGELVPSDLVPTAWVQAAYRAAWLQATNPGWATGAKDPNRVTRREQVDVISREFFTPSDYKGGDAVAGMPADAVINGLVLPWLCSNSRNFNSLMRVI